MDNKYLKVSELKQGEYYRCGLFGTMFIYHVYDRPLFKEKARPLDPADYTPPEETGEFEKKATGTYVHPVTGNLETMHIHDGQLCEHRLPKKERTTTDDTR